MNTFIQVLLGLTEKLTVLQCSFMSPSTNSQIYIPYGISFQRPPSFCTEPAFLRTGLRTGLRTRPNRSVPTDPVLGFFSRSDRCWACLSTNTKSSPGMGGQGQCSERRADALGHKTSHTRRSHPGIGGPDLGAPSGLSDHANMAKSVKPSSSHLSDLNRRHTLELPFRYSGIHLTTAPCSLPDSSWTGVLLWPHILCLARYTPFYTSGFRLLRHTVPSSSHLSPPLSSGFVSRKACSLPKVSTRAASHPPCWTFGAPLSRICPMTATTISSSGSELCASPRYV